MNKKTVAMIIAIVLVVILIGTVCYGYFMKMTNKIEHPIATITIEGYDEPIVVELYPEYALNTVKNFIALANNEFYNGLTIHRVEEYVIQGGDPNGDGTGGPTLSAINSSIVKDSDQDTEYSIVGEFKANGYTDNTLTHEKGVISMARTNYTSISSSLVQESYDSAGSQFFICMDYCPSFNGYYAAFGKVTSGWDTLDAISKVELKTEVDEETGEVTPTTTPAETITISSITVDTKGINYGMPETVEPLDYYSWYMSQMYNNSSSN